ncbi:hypothetical protein H2198_000991 [Neophaeococcomyces mojaviensis]|uniref:Uncharacterized protein n=1 Tax=Neophaeococcomyces mojaviensis TaxID=3383035 RepID=A0ACC3AJ27_9EURO|nr:hypothetical protein H2198_000991 [Knufia sp. JES_112]
MILINTAFSTALLGLQLLPVTATRSLVEQVHQKRTEQNDNAQMVGHDNQIGASIANNILSSKHHRLTIRQTTSMIMMSMNSAFPSTSTQVPIATVCPVGATAPRVSGSSALTLASLPTEVLSGVAGSIIAASATLPGGSTITFSSLAKEEKGTLPNLANRIDIARLVVGPNGCQTLYAPTTTAVCSTVITPFGMPPVSVTDCDQYITFSSETLFNCAPTPIITPLAASSNAAAVNRMANVVDQSKNPMATSTMEADSSGNEKNEDEGLDGTSTRTLISPTTRSFSPTGTSTSTLSGDGNAFKDKGNDDVLPRLRRWVMDGEAAIIFSYSAAPDVPMSLPRQMMEPLELEKRQKRQILMSPGINGPIRTDFATIAPRPSRSLPSVSFPPISLSPIITEVLPIPSALGAKNKRDWIHLHRSADDPVNNTSDKDTFRGDHMRLTDVAGSVNQEDTVDLNQLSPPSPTKYYAAPWYEISQGGVPLQVQAIICSGGLAPSAPSGTAKPDADGDTEAGECLTFNEAWSVTTLTRTRTGTSIASFDGPAVITYGGTARTTVIHFTQTVTTTRTEPYQSVVHTTLGPVNNRLADVPTVTDVRTNPGPTQTISLLPFHPFTSSTTTSIAILSPTMNMDAQMKQAAAAAPESGACSLDTYQPVPVSPSPVTTPSLATKLPFSIVSDLASVTILTSDETQTPASYSTSTKTPVPFIESGNTSNVSKNLGNDARVNTDGFLTTALSNDNIPTTFTQHLTVATATVTVPLDGAEAGDGMGIRLPGSLDSKMGPGMLDTWPSDVWIAGVPATQTSA